MGCVYQRTGVSGRWRKIPAHRHAAAHYLSIYFFISLSHWRGILNTTASFPFPHLHPYAECGDDRCSLWIARMLTRRAGAGMGRSAGGVLQLA